MIWVLWVIGSLGEGGLLGKDWALANNQWSDLFPQAALINSEMTRSDHRPIVMDMNYLPRIHGGSGVVKRFEARWL